MNCWRCNAELSDEMLTCPECGSTPRARSRRVRCRHCGRRSPIQLRVCPFCGRDLTKAWPHRLVWAFVSAVVILGVALLAVRYVHLDIGGWRGTAAARLQGAANWLAQAPAVVLPTVILPPSPTQSATPTASSTPTAAAPATSTPSKTHTPTASPSPSSTPVYGSYSVRSGDTPASIALQFNVSVEELMQVNDIADPGSLQVDQELTIPLTEPTQAPPTSAPTEAAGAGTLEALQTTEATFPSPTTVATGVLASAAASTPTPEAVAIAAAGERLYKVVPGDTLSMIAQEFGVSVDAIMSANGITNPLQLQVSQELVIPAPSRDSAATPLATVAAATPTSEPTQTPTVAALRPAPLLINPEEGKAYSGDSAIIELKWSGVDGLGPDEEFVVHVGYLEADGSVVWVVDRPQEQPLRDISWYVPGWVFGLAPQDSGRTYVWYIQVESVVRDETGAFTGDREPVSAPSEQHRFSWQ